MSFNPADFGIAMSLDAENVVHAFQQYEKLVASLKGETVKQETPKLDSEEDQELADEFVSSMRESLFSLLGDNPILSLVLVDALSSIVKDTKEFRAWFIADETRKGSEVPQVDGNKEVAEKLRECVERLYFGARDFGVELPKEFATKQNKEGKTVPAFSRLPYEKGSATGGKVGGYTLRYKWTPELILSDWETETSGEYSNWEGIFENETIEIPAGTFTDEIAMRYVSTPTYRVARSDVFDALPHRENVTPTGQTRRHLDMPKDGSSVFVQFDSGVLEAWLPIDSTEEEVTEEDSEEETETE